MCNLCDYKMPKRLMEGFLVRKCMFMCMCVCVCVGMGLQTVLPPGTTRNYSFGIEEVYVPPPVKAQVCTFRYL